MAVLGVITIVACHACWKPYVSLFLCHSLVVHTNYVIIVHKYLSPFMSGVSWCTKQIHWVDGYVAFVSFTGQNYSIFKSIKPIMCYRYMYIVVGWSVDMNLLEETDFFFGKSTTNAIIKLIDINTNHCYDKLNISFSKMSLCFWIKFATSKWSTSVLMMIGAKKTETNLVFSFTEWMSCVRRTLQK